MLEQVNIYGTHNGASKYWSVRYSQNMYNTGRLIIVLSQVNGLMWLMGKLFNYFNKLKHRLNMSAIPSLLVHAISTPIIILHIETNI